MIFVNSMSDLFHEDLGADSIQAVFDVIFRAKQHVYQILTKRAKRMSEMLPHVRYATGQKWADSPEPNVHLGVSVEAKDVLERIDWLRRTPARVRFVSVEPLLEEVDLSPYLGDAELKQGPLRGVDWAIVGGESGPGARPCEPEWIRKVVRQCQERGVPVFVKQLGSVWARKAGQGADGPFDSKGGDPEEWPEDLRVREFPKDMGRPEASPSTASVARGEF